MDLHEFEGRLSTGRYLSEAIEAVRSGRLDHVGLLDALRRSVESAEYVDSALADSAATLVGAIWLRRSYVLSRYHKEIQADPSLEPIYKAFDRRALHD